MTKAAKTHMRGISSILTPTLDPICRFLSKQGKWAFFTDEMYGPTKEFDQRVLKGAAMEGDWERYASEWDGELTHELWLSLLIFLATVDKDPIGFIGVFMGSEMYRTGLKIIQPSAEQCEALEHVKINLDFDEYEQPYPLTVVELPDAYRNEVSKRHGVVCPPFVASYRDPDSRAIFVVTFDPAAYTEKAVMEGRFGHLARFFRPVDDGLIEEQLHGDEKLIGYAGLNEREEGLMLDLSRIALNTCLMLTYLGVSELGNPHIEGLARRAQGNPKNRAKKRRVEKAKRQLEEAKLVEYIAFRQQIAFSTKEEDHSERPTSESGRLHASPRPHWRKGHFRMQACGKNWSQRRKTFIKPIMVRRDRYVGDLADTGVTYKQDEGA